MKVNLDDCSDGSVHFVQHCQTVLGMIEINSAGLRICRQKAQICILTLISENVVGRKILDFQNYDRVSGRLENLEMSWKLILSGNVREMS